MFFRVEGSICVVGIKVIVKVYEGIKDEFFLLLCCVKFLERFKLLYILWLRFKIKNFVSLFLFFFNLSV